MPLSASHPNDRASRPAGAPPDATNGRAMTRPTVITPARNDSAPTRREPWAAERVAVAKSTAAPRPPSTAIMRALSRRGPIRDVGPRLEQLEAACARDRLRAGGGVELAVDAPRVRLDRVLGHEQLAADLPQRETGRQQTQDVELAVAQLIATARCPPVRRPHSRAQEARVRAGLDHAAGLG